MSTSDRPTDMGINRTGIALSPIDGPATIEGANAGLPSSSGSARAIAEVRVQYAREAGPVGHMPPPVTLRGVRVGISKDWYPKESRSWPTQIFRSISLKQTIPNGYSPKGSKSCSRSSS